MTSMASLGKNQVPALVLRIILPDGANGPAARPFFPDLPHPPLPTSVEPPTVSRLILPILGSLNKIDASAPSRCFFIERWQIGYLQSRLLHGTASQSAIRGDVGSPC